MSTRRALVLGGTRYFGKRLVQLLIDDGWEITLASRGKTKDPFGDRVTRAQVERESAASMRELAARGTWEVVYDQICYSPDEATIARDAFAGRAGRWVHTSTQSVYEKNGRQREADYDPLTHPLRAGRRSDFGYGEAKRQAEAVWFQTEKKMPVVAMRIPIVLGPDDYTGRLEFHVDHVRDRKVIVAENPEAEASFISSAEAARFLHWLGTRSVTGPLNACSAGSITLRALLDLVSRTVGRPAHTANTGPEEDYTPFVDSQSRIMDNGEATGLGFDFEPLLDWLPALIEEVAARRPPPSLLERKLQARKAR